MYRSLDCLCTSCAAADQVARIWPYFGNLQLLTGICLVLCCNREIGPLLVFNNQPFAAVVVVALKRVVVASLREQQWLIGSTPDCHMQSQIQIWQSSQPKADYGSFDRLPSRMVQSSQPKADYVSFEGLPSRMVLHCFLSSQGRQRKRNT